MKLLVVCPHFAPDVAPTGDVMTAIVEQFAALGHEVHVVTSLVDVLNVAPSPCTVN